MTAAPGDDTRLFVVEQRGRIRVIENGTLLDTPFLDISSLIPSMSQADEWGLLGLVFHPEHATNRRFFVFYMQTGGRSIVAEYATSANNPNLAEAAPTQTVLSIEGPVAHHFGGMMAFGRDGYLYVSSGDRGDEARAQNLSSRNGKMLRLDVDNPASAPPGNMPGADSLVWSYGLRNVWRFSFDRCTGDLYMGDVGGAYEEVNIEPHNTGHRNYGWPVADTGTNCSTGTCPVFAVDHNFSDCSMVGGYVYRGSAIPNMNGRYLFGDWCTNRITTLVWTGGTSVEQVEDLRQNLDTANTLVAMSSFGEDNQGNVYVVDLAGALYRIDAE
ncbi:uncharacterized protein CMC5_082080 [Chondromyces crocatus]|uniref:Glucose/Sorbosone dehydrogenase domain-containing protein n=2 Tax=Chondromyces crocatus TaxID=52 RepID=A0A0K1ESQ9_CHOCO|nr:uncharacterized protein CMC5_082080 [Chondromyces crocatus]